MEKNGGELINCAKVISFGPNMVRVSRNISAGVPDPYNTWEPIIPKNIENPLAKKIGDETYVEELSCDLVVLAMGGRADEQAFLSAQQAGVAPEVYNIGDSFFFRREIKDATGVSRR